MTTPAIGPAHIRPARDADLDRVRAIYDAIVTDTTISFDETTPSRDELARRMRSRPRLPWLVAESDGDVVGYAYAARHGERSAYRWSVDCSVYVAATHRGRGVGRLLLERLIDELRGLGYVSVFAGIALPNPPSVRLHESLGFRSVGVLPSVGFKHGAWHDVGWWRRQLDPVLPAAPEEPRAWRPDGPDHPS
jgi:L-amino acid N-acyltransferase YncA